MMMEGETDMEAMSLDRLLGGASTEARICCALVELLHEEPLADISVKELCSRAYVARSTFYAHYRNVDDVLAAIEQAAVEDLTVLNDPLATASPSDAASLSFFQGTLAYLDEHRDLMGVLLVERPDARFIARWKEAIEGHLRARSPMAVSTTEGEFTIDLVASSMVSGCAYLVEHSTTLDVEKACTILADILRLLDRWM